MDEKTITLETEWNRGLILGDEWANAITHALGLILSLLGTGAMLVWAWNSEDGWRLPSLALYGGSLIVLYTASTLYHTVRKPHLRRLWRVVDHCAIYILIAGSYTPFMLVALRGAWGWGLFGTVWVLAITGIICKIFYIDRFKRLLTGLYLLMGWLIIIATEPLMQVLPPGGVYFLVAGGLCYTGGVVFFVMDKRRFYHAIWHLFVLGGSICHYVAVFFYV